MRFQILLYILSVVLFSCTPPTQKDSQVSPSTTAGESISATSVPEATPTDGSSTPTSTEAKSLPPSASNGKPEGLAKVDEDFNYNEYFSIQNQDALSEVDLLKQDEVVKAFPKPGEDYNRQKHFGGWIHYKNDQKCMDTRGLVLERDSSTPVQTSSNCKVTSGDWQDNYTDKEYFSATDMQIDHVVPLKHAYMTGAADWDYGRRCLYANYMGNNFHLLAVNGRENMRKGDRGPRQYIPPNQKFTCDYLKIWLTVKYLWELKITPTEKTKIDELLADKSCRLDDLKLTKTFVQEQRQYMRKNKNLCVGVALASF